MKSALHDACTIRLKNFEGPFDLLFYLIEKNQIDIYDIPIVEITDQYMDYLFAMQEMDLEIASVFLVMASTLLHIKSKLLLPVHQNEQDTDVDPREELILKLVEYRKAKEFAALLKEREKQWQGAYYKLPEILPESAYEINLEVSSLLLRDSYQMVLQNYQDRQNNDTKKMNRILQHEKVSLRLKIKEILSRLKKSVRLSFSKVFNLKKMSRLEVATGFLAALEIVRMGKASISQEQEFGEIFLEHIDGEPRRKETAVYE
ncbi:MAG: segregation/condensation protein A [Clostridiaceae bacterium]|jgi:segregation and condensation protein A|nr:segregation/condensation protein A [Clostridiaceae bacterium]